MTVRYVWYVPINTFPFIQTQLHTAAAWHAQVNESIIGEFHFSKLGHETRAQPQRGKTQSTCGTITIFSPVFNQALVTFLTQ
jgi:hypothetical protein